MKRYYTASDLWKIEKEYNFEHRNDERALEELNQLIDNLSKNVLFEVKDGQLTWTPHYNIMDYNYTASVIGSDEYKIEQKEKLIHAIEAEKDLIIWMVDRINAHFKDYTSLPFLDIYFCRYIHNMNYEKIMHKHLISKDRYYAYLHTAEYLMKESFGLYTRHLKLLQLDGTYKIF